MELTQVRMLRASNGLTLVEWFDPKYGNARAWITSSMIVSENGNLLMVDRPERGIPEGEDVLDGWYSSMSTDKLLRELRDRNIWTYADVLARPNDVRAAVTAAASEDFSRILVIARNKSKNGGL